MGGRGQRRPPGVCLCRRGTCGRGAGTPACSRAPPELLAPVSHRVWRALPMRRGCQHRGAFHLHALLPRKARGGGVHTHTHSHTRVPVRAHTSTHACAHTHVHTHPQKTCLSTSAGRQVYHPKCLYERRVMQQQQQPAAAADEGFPLPAAAGAEEPASGRMVAVNEGPRGLLHQVWRRLGRPAVSYTRLTNQEPQQQGRAAGADADGRCGA